MKIIVAKHGGFCPGLRRAVRLSTGVELPIINTPADPMICLGDNPTTEKAGFSASKLNHDSFRIVTKGKNLFIFGKDTPDKFPWRGWESMGTIFGVCEFLESVVGVRWLMPGELGEEIPKHEELKVQEMDQTQTPEKVRNYK